MVGQTLGHYKIIELLGKGGMGEVYRAEDSTLKRELALKILPADLASSQERLERFQREAETLAALNHPNIVHVYTVEEDEGTHFLTMELVEGQPLSHWIRDAGMPVEQIFEIAIPLSDALATAHEKGVVHRDLKPANVMVTSEGRVKVLDFGLAKLRQEAGTPLASELPTEPLTDEGKIVGTMPYMSPEQLEGKEIDHRSDLFSLGVVLYEMATGERPFKGDSSASLIAAILKEQPRPVDALKEDLPHHLGRIVRRCLEKEPGRRYQSALEIGNELRDLKDELASTQIREKEQPLPAPRYSPRWLWASAGIALLVLAVAAAWWIGRDPPERSYSPAERGPSSVAVLPFVNLSPDPENEYFSDGMTEELLQALANIEDLKVPSRSAIFALKGKDLDLQQVAERLGVETVVEGGVRKAGNRLRITAQLVQASDGFQLWSETFDRELEDVFAIQDEIARRIATALQVTLSPGLEQELKLGGTDNSTAYDFYLRGSTYFERVGVEGYEYACQMFERAIAHDPDYALAYAALASCHSKLYELSGEDLSHLEGAKHASVKAMELAPDLGEAHAARAGYLQIAGEPVAAAQEYEEAIRLEPRKARIYFDYGYFLRWQGQLERAVELWERAIELDPEFQLPINLLPQIYSDLGREEEQRAATRRAAEAIRRHLELNPDDGYGRLFLAFSQLDLGDRDQAFDSIRQVQERFPNDPLRLYAIACFYSLAGEVDEALEILERAFEAGLRQRDFLQEDSDLDNIRDDPRFQALLEKYGQEPRSS